MSEMVDRVARAVYAKLAAYTYPIVAVAPDAFDKESKFRKDQMREWACTTIAAMREPTEAMYDAVSNCGIMWRENNSTNVYHLMLDAALAETPPAIIPEHRTSGTNPKTCRP
jgi:hypothetical protein